MKKIFIALAFLGVILGIQGCSTVGTVKTAAETYIKKGVDEVCTANDERRAVMRQEIDKVTAPHVVRIECKQPDGKS